MSSKNDFNTALVTINYAGHHWDKIEKSLLPANIIRCDPDDDEAIAEALIEAEIAILAGDINDTILEKGNKLKWIHCNHSGINNSSRPEVFKRGIILTSSAGRSGPVLAEHVFFLLLSLVYRSRKVEQMQREHLWDNIYTGSRGLYGKKIGIIGLGFTGREVAARAKAFGMTVLAYDRDVTNLPVTVDKFYKESQGYDELLRESDAVVLSIRLSNTTFHMIGKNEFSIMKKSAFLINMARGAIVDETALAIALKKGEIAGCGSDVFETEPLQPESPLWDLPNMIITPHCTPEMPDMPGNCVEIICDNINAFRTGTPLRNAVDIRDVYTKDM